MPVWPPQTRAAKTKYLRPSPEFLTPGLQIDEKRRSGKLLKKALTGFSLWVLQAF
jgi:hypothetical protein